MGQFRVHECKSDSLVWRMETSKCHISTRSGEYTYPEEVDPYPAYPHDFELVVKEFRRAFTAFPVSGEVDLYVFSRETVWRNNGYCRCSNLYDETKSDQGRISGWQASIVLAGKRTPIHPAMTRYLVAHEYGHAVAWHLARARGLQSPYHGNFYREYSDMRGGSYYEGDKGGEWHVSTAEVFANDFRILALGVEDEFWPHPQARRPRELTKLADFWNKALRDAQKETDDGTATG